MNLLVRYIAIIYGTIEYCVVSVPFLPSILIWHGSSWIDASLNSMFKNVVGSLSLILFSRVWLSMHHLSIFLHMTAWAARRWGQGRCAGGGGGVRGGWRAGDQRLTGPFSTTDSSRRSACDAQPPLRCRCGRRCHRDVGTATIVTRARSWLRYFNYRCS